jgi:hypothetical protein
VEPVWEDPKNTGAFVLKFQKDGADKIWEDIILGFVAKNVEPAACDLINGVRSKARKDALIVEIWVSDANSEDSLEKVREWIIKTTCLNQDTLIEVIKFQPN